MKEYIFWQSCGFPLKKDKKGGRSEKDRKTSSKFCSMCNENGEFLSPREIDAAKKMQMLCIQEMKKDRINGCFAWFATRSTPKLERWKR